MELIVLNPFLDSLCNFSFKNIGLTPGIPKGCFQHPQDVVEYVSESDVASGSVGLKTERYTANST
jgi:hypothetical protein